MKKKKIKNGKRENLQEENVVKCFYMLVFLLCWMSMACDYAQLPLNNPQQNLKLLRRKKKKTKKKTEKSYGNLHTNAGHKWTAFKCFSPIDWLIVKTGTDSSNSLSFLSFVFFSFFKRSCRRSPFSTSSWSSWNDLNWQILLLILQVIGFCESLRK